MRVIKYRGSDFGTNEYPYVIGDHGIVLFPLTKAELAHQPLDQKSPLDWLGWTPCSMAAIDAHRVFW